MPQILLVQVAEVRIERVAIEVDVFFGIARAQPRVLHGNVLVCHSGRQLSVLRLLHPVIPVIADGADELFLRDLFLGGLDVGDEPILRRHRSRRSIGKMLVVVHDHDAIHRRRDRLVVVVLVFHLHAGIELQSLRVQVRREFFQQRHVSWLPLLGKGFKVHHQPAVAVGREEEHDLAPEVGARFGIIQETVNARKEIGAIEVLHYRKHVHVRALRLQEGHDFVVHGVERVAVDHIEHLVGLRIDALQVAVRRQHLQPHRKEQINLARVLTQGRKAGGVP